MNPAELFNDALTFPAHENNDLHFIGEALPPPSQVSQGDINGVNALGASAVPSREDHSHRIDLTNYYTQAEVDALVLGGNPENFYTKVESDARYYTQTAIDAAFAALDYYTQAEVDALIAGVGGGDFSGEMSWAYAEFICDPGQTEVISSVWFPPQTIRIDEFWVGARVAGTVGNNYVVRVYQNITQVDSFVWTQPDTYQEDATISQIIAAGTSVSMSIIMQDVGDIGDAERVSMGIRYSYV